MLFNFHLPHYFASKVRTQIENLYAATAIGNLAQAMITLFEPIFLYQALHLSIVEVLLFFASLWIFTWTESLDWWSCFVCDTYRFYL
jgi:hypothetical protein